MITGKALNRTTSFSFGQLFRVLYPRKFYRDFAILFLSSSCA